MTKKRTITQAIENLIRGGTSNAVPRITEHKRTGRPTKEAEYIAMFANFQMCRPDITGARSLESVRTMAATLLHRGNPDAVEDQNRNAKRDIGIGERYLHGYLDPIVFAGDERGNGRSCLMLQHEHEGLKSVIEYRGDGLVDVLGFGWLCEWGERRARYGLIQSRGLDEQHTSFITVSQGVKK